MFEPPNRCPLWLNMLLWSGRINPPPIGLDCGIFAVFKRAAFGEEAIGSNGLFPACYQTPRASRTHWVISEILAGAGKPHWVISSFSSRVIPFLPAPKASEIGPLETAA